MWLNLEAAEHVAQTFRRHADSIRIHRKNFFHLDSPFDLEKCLLDLQKE
jgi:hypothetical protein